MSESQFECGPRPVNLPAPDVIQDWSTSQLFDLTAEYWFWGERCDKALTFNRNYFYCYKDDKEACKSLKALEAELKTLGKK